MHDTKSVNARSERNARSSPVTYCVTWPLCRRHCALFGRALHEALPVGRPPGPDPGGPTPRCLTVYTMIRKVDSRGQAPGRRRHHAAEGLVAGGCEIGKMTVPAGKVASGPFRDLRR